jgi:hypothetical protein
MRVNFPGKSRHAIVWLNNWTNTNQSSHARPHAHGALNSFDNTNNTHTHIYIYVYYIHTQNTHIYIFYTYTYIPTPQTKQVLMAFMVLTGETISALVEFASGVTLTDRHRHIVRVYVFSNVYLLIACVCVFVCVRERVCMYVCLCLCVSVCVHVTDRHRHIVRVYVF